MVLCLCLVTFKMGKISNNCLSDSEKRKKHRVVNKQSMRQARKNMSEEDLEERRRKDRDRYRRKKEQGMINNNKVLLCIANVFVE